MPRPPAATKAINLRIEHEHEQLVRDVIDRIRKGGPGFRAALRALIDDERAAEYVPAQEIHTRFGDLERRLSAMERETSETYLPADDIRALFAETEQRLREIERLALERVTRLGADSCGD